jgi:hypothetical protein
VNVISYVCSLVLRVRKENSITVVLAHKLRTVLASSKHHHLSAIDNAIYSVDTFISNSVHIPKLLFVIQCPMPLAVPGPCHK